MVENKGDQGAFEGPLENYEPRMFKDALEEVLDEQPVSAIHSSPVSTISPDTKVSEAVEHMRAKEVACLLVVENNKLMGLFSVRDVLNNVAEQYDAMKDLPVSEVMTRTPIFAYDTDASGAVLSVMAASGYRHVPVLDSQQTVVGIVSPQRVLDFLLTHLSDDEPADTTTVQD
jgi:CBS domain-containing protein